MFSLLSVGKTTCDGLCVSSLLSILFFAAGGVVFE